MAGNVLVGGQGVKVGRRPHERWWVPGYGTEVDVIKAKVAAIAVGTGYTGCCLPFVVAFLLPHAGIAYHWWALWAIVALVLVEGLVMMGDLRRLISDRYRDVPAVKALAQVMVATLATGLADYAAGGGHGAYRPVIIVPLLIAAVLGNTAFIAIVWTETMAVLTLVSLADGLRGGPLATLLLVCGLVPLVGTVMLQQLRNSQLRAVDGFHLLAEATEEILRAGGFEEALARFLPLVGLQAAARQVVAYRREATGHVPVGTWPLGSPPSATGVPDDVFGLARGLGRSTNGFVVRPRQTVIFSAGDADQAMVLVLARKPPRFWRQVSFRAVCRQLAMELGLLVNHRDFMAHLDELGRTDSLTGLANRGELVARIDDELDRSRAGAGFALAMIDLDHFKEFNDTYGHLQGDQALVELGRLLRDRSRGGDLAARYGGEEFCVVLHDTDIAGAVSFVDGILADVGHLHTARPLSCSVGLASGAGHDSPSSLLRAADRALYQAKEAGRARCVVAPPITAAGEATAGLVPAEHSGTGS